MDAFIETPRFDEVLSYGSSGGPEFKTFVFEGTSGLDARVVAWDAVKARYDMQKAIHDKDSFEAARNMFYNARGKARGFRFKDFHDYTATDEPCIGTVDGSNKIFKLQKRYVAGAWTFDRRIFKPVSGTLQMKVNGVNATHLSLDATTGTVTLLTAPTAGQTVTADFEFDVPVRFDTDKMAVSYDGYQLLTWGSIPLVEIIFED